MRRDDAVLADILEFARDILAFTAGLEAATFEADRKTQAAVLHRLMLIGEAVRRVSRQVRLAHPEVPWIRISNLRNVLIDDYDDVRLSRIWMVVTRDIPALIAVLDPLVRPADPGECQ
jgi:uncharacterized protein with HEPN domain